MTVDPTITFGALLNAFVLLIGFVVAFTKLGGRLDLMSQRLTAVEEAIRSWRDVTERLAVHSQMIVGMQNDIRDMKHGRGFVQARSEGGLNGEYS